MTWETPLIVAVAPNGARRTKAGHPAIPLTADEIARTAAACREAGASLPAGLLPYASGGGPAQPWFVCAFGPAEGACALTAAALGGHSRVGFENNLQLNDGSQAPDSAALVAQQMRGADAIGRPVADGVAARAALSMRS